MSAELIRRLRQARERVVEAGGFKFRYLRPTAEDISELQRDRVTIIGIAKRFVVGWEGVREQDIVKGGTDDPAEFSAELWAAWCSDRPDLWGEIGNAVMAAYADHAAQQERAEKNS